MTNYPQQPDCAKSMPPNRIHYPSMSGRRSTSIGAQFLALLFCLSTFDLAVGEDNLFRIQDPQVDVHRKASAESEITARVVADTQVMLIDRRGEWCEILAFDGDAHGFVRCRALGEQAVSSRDDSAVGRSAAIAERASGPIDIFWKYPSLDRLLEVGEYLEERHLDAAQLELERGLSFDATFDENRPPEITRFPIDEFEAMKRLLRDGVVAPEAAQPGFIPWSELKQVASDHALRRGAQDIQGRWFSDPIFELMTEGDMRPVEASLFTDFAELAPTSSSLEGLSARFGVRHRVQVRGEPEWAYVRHEGPLVAGSWDIGAFEQTLDEPVVEYVIGRQGLAAAMTWQPRMVRNLKEELEASCDEGIGFEPRARTRMSGYPSVEDPLIWFFADRPLPYKQADIKTYAKRLSDTGTNLLVIYEIDLNGDQVADLAAWEEIGEWRMAHDPARQTRLGARIFFANVAGSWYFLDYAEFTVCA